MPEARQDVQRLSPDKLMTTFSKSHIALCLIVAVGLHVAVVAATSTKYIHDTWIDPEGAELRRMAAERAREEAKADEKARRRAAATQRAATRPAKTKAAAGDVPERAKDHPVYRATTQKAAPNEIPADPGDLTVPLE
jgi:hypothetical protein